MKTVITILMSFSVFFSAHAMELERVINLAGRWRFEIGDDMEFADIDFDDSRWELVHVPSMWENEGFPGYDGYAWYRKNFHLPEDLKNAMLYVKLGYIDDVDQVYLNGHFLDGKGSFPPHYDTAYNIERTYFVPSELINFGEDNLLAVRVYDSEIGGGIVHGRVGIFKRVDLVNLTIDLSGYWQFNLGDDLDWAEYDYDDSDWEEIKVPAKWAVQGYGDYDGYGWYRKSFKIDRSLDRDRLILSLGKIDDYDETYFNGVRIGRTGRFPAHKYADRNNPFYDDDRFYTIPSSLIRWNDINVVAVRVYDTWRDGGIYDGSVGIITRDDYIDFKKGHKSVNRFFERIFNER